MGDARCQLLVENMPGLTTLNISKIIQNEDGNNLSDLAVRSIIQLLQLTELRVGTHTLMQAAIT